MTTDLAAVGPLTVPPPGFLGYPPHSLAAEPPVEVPLLRIPTPDFGGK